MRPIVRIAMTVAAAAAVLAGIEVAVRVADPYHGAVGISRLHPSREIELSPGFKGRYDGQDVYVDQLGFRGTEGRALPQRPKPPGIRRIMVFGDSFTFGQEIAFDETYPYLAEERLAVMRPGERWEVVNAGVPGYAPFQELEYMRETVEVFEPDLLVLQYTLNDAYTGPPTTGVRALLKPVLDILRVNSYAYQVARNMARPLTNTVPRPSTADEHPVAAWYRQIYDPGSSSWSDTIAQLRMIDEFAAARRIPLIVLVYGDLERPPQGVSRPDAPFRDIYPFEAFHRQVADAFGPDRRVILLDALHVLGDLPNGEVYETLRHPGPTANRHIASALAACILRTLDPTHTGGDAC